MGCLLVVGSGSLGFWVLGFGFGFRVPRVGASQAYTLTAWEVCGIWVVASEKNKHFLEIISGAAGGGRSPLASFMPVASWTSQPRPEVDVACCPPAAKPKLEHMLLFSQALQN